MIFNYFIPTNKYDDNYYYIRPPSLILDEIKNNINSNNLIILYETLYTLSKDKNYVQQYTYDICHMINKVIYFLIESDKKEMNDIFDTFCDKDFMNLFIKLSHLDNYYINLELIKCLSDLIINLKNKTILYYIYSKNMINQIITLDYMSYDEEFLSYYINFLKSLSLRIDNFTIHLFYDKQTNIFPLIENIIKLYNHKDNMIKNVVRNIILNILKIKECNIEDYFIKLPAISYFANIICYLKDLCIKLNDEINGKINRLNNIFDEIIDSILYLNDIYSLNLTKITFILNNSLFSYLIFPIIFKTILSKTSIKQINITTALILISLLFNYIKNENFRNCFFSLIFMEEINKDLLFYLQIPCENIFYSFEFNKDSQIKFWKFITINYNNNFIKTIIPDNNLIYLNHGNEYPQLKEIIIKCKKYSEFCANKKITKKDITFLDLKDKVINIINSYLTENEYELMSNYHKNLMSALGIKIGLYDLIDSNNNINNSNSNNEIYDMNIMCLIQKNFDYNFEGKKQKWDSFVTNEIKENFLSLLNSKNDNIVLLINIIIYICLNVCEIPEKLLKKCNLDFNIENRKINNENNLIENNKINNENNSIENNNNENENLNFENNHFNYNNEFFNNKYKNLDIIINNDKKFFILKILCNLLNTIPPFRKITYEILLENIKFLYNFNNNNIYNLNIENYIKLILTKIQNLINKNKNIRENGYKNFIKIWSFYNELNNENLIKKIINIISHTFVLIPILNINNNNNNNNNVNINNIKNYPEYLKDFNCHENINIENIFNNYLLMYMMIYDLNIIKNNNNNKIIIKNNFPFEYNDELKIDKTYDITKLINKSLYNTPIKFKSKDLEYYQKANLIIYKYNLYLVLLQGNLMTIVYDYHLRDIELYKNTEEKCTINIVINNNSVNINNDINNFTDLSLKFKNQNICDETADYLIDKIKMSINEEAILFRTYFDEKFSEFNIDINNNIENTINNNDNNNSNDVNNNKEISNIDNINSDENNNDNKYISEKDDNNNEENNENSTNENNNKNEDNNNENNNNKIE